MGHLVSTARNIAHMIIDGEIVTEIEFVLTICHRESVFAGGSQVMSDRLETVRFRCSTEGAEAVANQILEWVEQASAEAGSITLSKG